MGKQVAALPEVRIGRLKGFTRAPESRAFRMGADGTGLIREGLTLLGQFCAKARSPPPPATLWSRRTSNINIK